MYLDGMPRDASREINLVAYNTFIEQQSELLRKVKKSPRWKEQKSSNRSESKISESEFQQ